MQWWEQYFLDVDCMDSNALERWMHEDVTVGFGNASSLGGRAKALAMLTQFQSNFTAMRHDLTGAVQDGDCVVVEAIVTFTLPDRRQFQIPAATVMRRAGTRIAELRVYMDGSAMFAPHYATVKIG